MDTRTTRQKAVNIGGGERIASVIGGGALIAYAAKKRSWMSVPLAAIGGEMIYRGATGHCQLYQVLGVHTARTSGRHVSVPYELGIRVDSSVTIDKTPEELYRFWRNLENLPRFMQFLICVQEMDNRRSHWVAKGPAGSQVQWDAEIINEKENELIGWRSLPGADVSNAGSVHFQAAPGDRGTVVKIELQYEPPAGTVGAWVAKIMGNDPERIINQDLHRLKTLLETGEIPTTEGQSSGRRKGAMTEATQQLEDIAKAKPASRKGWNRDQVTTASEDSFPASDPPSWTPAAI